MPIESREPQFRAEQPPQPESPGIAQAERDLNEIIPMLTHGLVRRIEQKGFSGKVRVRAMAGHDWGVAKSPDNPTEVPNVIIYPRESLTGDKRLVNARLRHEIGNLNYPIDAELNDLRDWCATQGIAPELLTSLVEATHEASVNYLEMRASHSDKPEENFKALYKQEVDTQAIANNIASAAPYKQAVDITLLYSLSQIGLIPKEQFEQALQNADPVVREIFDKQTRSVLDQIVKMAVPKKQVQLVRDYVWPKFSKLVALSGLARKESAEPHDQKAEQLFEETSPERGSETSAWAQQAKELQEKIQQMMQKMRQQFKQAKAGKKPSPAQQRAQRKETPKTQEQQLSPAEKQERKEEENLLAQSLQEQLQQAKDQLKKMGAKLESKPQEKLSLQEIGKQAEQMRQEAEKAMQETKETGIQDEVTEEQLQKLKEQLEQLEEVAKQIAESGALEEELAKPEEEPMTYNIKEYGIDEAKLTPEQLENLQKTRSFVQNTSRVYRTAMRLLMKGYQQHNPKFTDRMMQKMMERGYDLPDFSLYGSQAAQEFLSERKELGIDGFSDNFLVNFQLPKPLAKFWYKGGNGSKSVPVKEGEIEWGYFYRMCMPVIYSGIDRAQMSGLYLNRLNQFGQHDPKKYYYLWETINLEQERKKQEEEALKEMQEQLQQMKEKLDGMRDQSAEKTSNEKGEQSGQKSESAESQEQQGQKAGDKEQAGSQSKEAGQQGEKSEKPEQKSGEQKQSDQEQQSGEQGENKLSPQELKKQIDDLKEQVDQMIKDAEERGDQAMADELKEIKEQLEQMAEKLEQGDQGETGKGMGQGKGVGQPGGQPGGQGGQIGQEAGEPGGFESGSGSVLSTQEMQELMSQMQDMLSQVKEQGDSGVDQEAIDQLLEQLSQMQQILESGASLQEMAGLIQDAMQQISEIMSDMQDEGQGQGEGQRDFSGHEPSTEKHSGGKIDEQGFKKSKVKNESSLHDPSHRGGAGNTVEGEGVTFSKPDPSLLAQLRNIETLIGSKFTQQDESGNFVKKVVTTEQITQISREQLAEIERKSTEQLSNLEELKRQHEAKMQAMYKEMSRLDGEALQLYIEYMESMRDLTNDLTDFFIKKFDLDRDYIYERNQRRGARLQRGYTKNILGIKKDLPVINPHSFERRREPEMPQFVWTIIIDNTGSVGGMIEDEKKLAVSLVEVTKRLNIPFEIVIYTEGGYQFLKTFEQEGFGENLQKIVLLQATIGNQQDTDLLRAAYASQIRFADKYKRAHNFIFFLTDGLACSTDSLNELVRKFKKETVILGVGLAEGAVSIEKEFGKNALGVPDSKQLSVKFIRKLEELIDQTFD